MGYLERNPVTGEKDMVGQMPRTFDKPLSVSLVSMILIVLQLICAVLFLGDLASEFATLGRAPADIRHIVLETVAIICLLAGIAFEWREGKRLLRRAVVMEEKLKDARRTVFDLIETHFDSWGLTPSERDVAGFVVKGLPTSEIAELRGCSESTVKAHLNAVYRKSGSVNRAGMLSHVIDGLVNDTFDDRKRGGYDEAAGANVVRHAQSASDGSH